MNNIIKPQGCTNLKIRQLNRMVTRHYDHYVAASGLKITQYSLLSYVVNQGPIRPSDLARGMQMDTSTLTRNMQSLVAQGWLKIGEGCNARSRLVAVTDAGRLKQAEGKLAWKAAQRTLNEWLGEERVQELHTLIDACIACLGDEPPDAV